jgi:hypothetical protein
LLGTDAVKAFSKINDWLTAGPTGGASLVAPSDRGVRRKVASSLRWLAGWIEPKS